MSRGRWIVVAVCCAAIAAGAWLLLRPRGGEGDAESRPSALVTIAPIQLERVNDTVQAYGVVAAGAEGATTVAAPRALVVLRVDVAAGQSVAAGQALIETAPAPAAGLAWAQAQDALKQAQADDARIQRLFAEKLAASDQVAAADRALADARAAAAAQTAQGGGGGQTLRAPVAGVVTSLSAAAGEHVAQDAPLATLARAGALGAEIGLDPAAGRFTVGQRTIVSPATGGDAITTRLSRVAAMVDPATRLLDAFAPLPAGAPPIGAAVSAEVVTGEHQGLVVPRAAIVSDETGAHVFIVAGGKARRVFVRVGQDLASQGQGPKIEISGPVAAGDAVAVQGAYELQDGMAVRIAGR